LREDTTPGLIPDFVPSDQISICHQKKGKDGDRLPLSWKRAGLESEAQTKFNLPRAVDLRGHTERRTAKRAPVAGILEIHVGVVEPRMIENVAERRNEPGVEPLRELNFLRYGQVEVPLGEAAERSTATLYEPLDIKYYSNGR